MSWYREWVRYKMFIFATALITGWEYSVALNLPNIKGMINYFIQKAILYKVSVY